MDESMNVKKLEEEVEKVNEEYKEEKDSMVTVVPVYVM